MRIKENGRKVKYLLILTMLVFILVVFFAFSKNESYKFETSNKVNGELAQSEIKDKNLTKECGNDKEINYNSEIVVQLFEEESPKEENNAEKIKVSANKEDVVAQITYVEESKKNNEANETITINKIESNEECLTVPSEINGKKIAEIEENAFKECYNLETIKVPVSLESIIKEIRYFEVNKENSDTEYIELNTTREYSEIYKAYMELTEEEKAQSLITPYKFEVLSADDTFELRDEALPSKYDLREYIEIEVEDQGDHGTCYAYSGLTSLETWIAKHKGELVDFSEVHASVYSSGSGGQFDDLKSYFNSGEGPIWEVDYDRNHFGDNLSTSDYNIINGYLKSADGYTDSQIEYMKSLLVANNIIGKIETTRKILPSNDTIKEHIMTYGAAVSYYYNDFEYMKTYNGYTVYNYKGDLINFPNHAVSIIGWDDNFSRYNFPESIRPDSNGAFLVLNSWGENWGTDGGCFWVSYEDTWLGWHAIDGVTNVTYLGETIKLNEIVIKDFETGSSIEKINNINNLVKRGTNIEMNLDLRYTSSNTLVNVSDLTAIVRNPIEGVNTNLTVSSKDGYITIPVDTKTFNVGSHYIIDVKCGSETVSKSVKIIENLYDYEIKDDNTIRLTKYNGDQKNVVIPQEYAGLVVTEIGTKLFYNNDVIETVIIGDNIQEIKSYAFANCNNLRSIEIPQSVTNIESNAFNNCTSLESVTVYCNTVGQQVMETSYNYELNIIHNYEPGIVEPTCTVDGYTASICTGCAKSYDIVYTEELKAKGHNEIIDERVEPTCGKEGLTEGKHCSICSEVLLIQEEIPTLDHDIVNNEA